MNRSTFLGRAFRRSPELARATLRAEIDRAEGNVRRLAFALGFHRSWLVRLLSRERLWDDVEQARDARRSRAWLVNARAELEQRLP